MSNGKLIIEFLCILERYIKFTHITILNNYLTHTNLLFYPFEKDKTLVDTWPHTKDITYYKKENGKEKSFTYSLVLKSTDKIEYALLYDTTTEKLINDTSSGKRMFLIEDVQVLNCSIETKN